MRSIKGLIGKVVTDAYVELDKEEKSVRLLVEFEDGTRMDVYPNDEDSICGTVSIISKVEL